MNDLWEIFFIGCITGAVSVGIIMYPLVAKMVSQLEEERQNRKFWQGRHKRGFQERINGRF